MHPFNNMISLAQESTSATAPVLAGNSFEAHALRQLVAIAAKTQAPVQLTGPTGSGHLDIAKAIHDLSSLASEPFVAADNEQMSEDHFEIRWEGTLFLGDVGHLSHSVKNALMEWMASPYGANVRVVTSAYSESQSDARLAKLVIPCPALSQRVEDIPIILQRLWASGTHPLPPIFDQSAWSILLAHDWPGNFQELRDFSEKASRLHGGKRVSTDQVRKSLGQYAARELARGDFSLKQHLAQEEKLFMIEALLRCSGNVQSAAGLAGIKRTTFLAKMQRHGLARI